MADVNRATCPATRPRLAKGHSGVGFDRPGGLQHAEFVVLRIGHHHPFAHRFIESSNFGGAPGDQSLDMDFPVVVLLFFGR